jgi:ABC-type thiamin/hydroxymethylpyrimidine transport system permease subunit
MTTTWKPWSQSRNLGMLLLGIWLIATGALPLLSITVPYSALILAVLAIAAGVLILLGR